MQTITSPLDRFQAKVHVGAVLQVPDYAAALGPCDLWTASAGQKNGYGTFWADGAKQYAHHWLWVVTNGPLPAGLYPDHLCHSWQWCAGGPTCPHRRCVNLRHLQLATTRVNNRRGCSPAGVNARKPRCHRGHPLTGGNVYRHPSRGTRHCRACQARRNAAFQAARHRPGAGQLTLTY